MPDRGQDGRRWAIDDVLLHARSALLVPVPAADPAVSRHRWRLDPSAAAGVRSHVLVRAPFLAPDALDPDVVELLRGVLAEQAPFDCVFDQVRWFERDAVWLAPLPERPFLALRDAVEATVPGLPDRAGRYHDAPHLPVGYRAHSSEDDLRIAAAQIGSALPVRHHVGCVLLMARPDLRSEWRTVVEFPLGRPVRSTSPVRAAHPVR